MARLLIVRHAIAQDRVEAHEQQRADAERPLTDKGRRRMQQAAAGIRLEAGPLQRILTSPLLRAQQTAEILASEFPGAEYATTETLSPGEPRASLLDELAALPEKDTVAVVGHEPDLGILVAVLLCSTPQAAIQMKKGGAALLNFPSHIAAGEGTLLWLLTPGQLRAIGSAKR